MYSTSLFQHTATGEERNHAPFIDLDLVCNLLYDAHKGYTQRREKRIQLILLVDSKKCLSRNR